MTKLLWSLRRRSSSRSSSHWGRWPTCRCPAFRPGARSGFLIWRQRILFISCPLLSLEPCSSSWRWKFFYFRTTFMSHFFWRTWHEQVNKWCKGDTFWWLDVTSFFSWVPSLVSTTPTCEPWKPCSGSCPSSSSPWPSTSLQSVCCTLSSDVSSVCSSMSKSLLYFLLSNPPQAVFTYWLTSNCFSLGQVALLRLPVVREKFNIPEKIKHPASALPQNDGFVQSIKKGGFLYAGWRNLIIQLFNVCCWSFCAGWKNAQLAQQLEERERRIKNHLDLAAKGQSHRFICQLCQLNARFVHILLTKCLKWYKKCKKYALA